MQDPGKYLETPMPTVYKRAEVTPRSPKRLAFSLIAILLGLTVPLFVLEVVLRFLPVTSATGTMVVDDTNPIVRFAPSQTFTFYKGRQFAHTNTGRISNDGVINAQDYVKAGKQRPLMISGDSYVEAKMVPYEETVQGRLAKVLEAKTKVYSIGVSGSSLSQYLAFAEYAWAEFHPQAMAFIIIGNDFDESLLKYKSEPGFHYFKESDSNHDLNLVRIDYRPSLTKRVIRASALARYLWGTVGIGEVSLWPNAKAEYVGNTAAHVSEERLADSRRVVDVFFSELPKRVGLSKDRYVFVVDAMRPQIYSDSDLTSASDSYFGHMRKYFLEQAKINEYEAIDMQSRFLSRHLRDGSRFEFTIDSHWNGVGHQEAAEAIATSRAFETVWSY